MKTKAGLYPFWFWNSRLTKDEIRRQIGEMAAQGVKGFYIHPRQGLAQPYLSDSFFSMVDVAIDEAEKLGLEVNLYDEYPYPSGIAGGEVVIGRPAHAATRLVLVNERISGGPIRHGLPRGRVWSCFLYPETDDGIVWRDGRDFLSAVGFHLSTESYHDTGLTAYNRKRYFADVPTPVLETEAPAGSYRLLAAVQVEVEDFKYWGRYVDVLNPEAMKAFIEMTHERYRQRYGDRFGKGIASIFADETQAGWSERLPEAFLSEYGRELDFSALAEKDHPDHLRTSADLEGLKYRLFLETFEKPIADWCRRHGIAYAGEKPCARLSQFSFMDVPGIDSGHAKTGGDLELLHPALRNNARAVASAAWFYGKEECLCECYHSLGWSATLNDARWIADGLMLMGITRLVPHGFFYSTHGLKKHDAPPSFFFQMPYWRHFGHLSQRVERIGEAFEGTHIEARILVVDPNSGLPSRDDLVFYRGILEKLSAQHLGFHLVDTDILESARIEDGRACLREIEADWVIVPPMPVVEGPLGEWLGEFESRGGKVIRWNADNGDQVEARLFREVKRELRIQKGGVEAGAIYSVRRVGKGKKLWFLLNLSGESHEVILSADTPLREVPLEPGGVSLLKPEEGGVCRRLIEPFEAVMLEAAGAESFEERLDSPVQVPTPDEFVRVEVPSEAAVRRLTPNLVRLGEWEMCLLDADGRAGVAARVPAVPLANQLEKGEFAFRPEFIRAFGMAPKLELPSMRMRYEAGFDMEGEFPVTLVVEPESLAGEWVLYVNEDGPFTEADLGSVEVHVRGSLGLDVTSMLKPGTNRLRIDLSTALGDAGLRNPLYLAGDFAVSLAPAGSSVRMVLSRESAADLDATGFRGLFENYEKNGLPFFSGTVEYMSAFTLEKTPEGENVALELAYPGEFEEAAEVSINGGPFIPSPWPPRRFLVPGSCFKPGRNELITRVDTGLCRSFEGQWFDARTHRYRDAGDSGS